MFWFLFIAVSPIGVMFIVQSYYKTTINSSKKVKKVYLFWCGLILFLMTALRNKSLGSVDATNYYNNWIKLRESSFEQLKLFIDKSDMESGYLFTVWCISHIIYEPQFLFVLTGLLFTISICRLIYLNSENVMLSMVMAICLGLYTFMLQGLRQSIAISICLFALEYCKKRKLFPFLFLLAIAFLFHRTVIVFSITYFLYGPTFTNKTKIGAIGLGLGLFLLAPIFVRYGNQFLDRDYVETAASGALIASAIYTIILVAAFLFTNEKNTNQTFTFFVMITIVGAAFYLMRYVGAQVMDRISFNFIIGQCIVLPTVFQQFNKTSRDILLSLVCCICIALFMYRTMYSYATMYLFFWQ